MSPGKSIMNVLFLCTGNSARSLIAEAVLNRRSDGIFKGFSAGSRPKGRAHPVAIETLENAGYDTARLRSKSWDEFAGDAAVPLDWVITLCDSAVAEACPVWPGAPATRHWGLPDPAAIEDPEACRAAFARTLETLERRVADFLKDASRSGATTGRAPGRITDD